MNIANLFKIAIKALSNNKMRGFLTMLGIIIGVGSVITMLAIGQGSKESIKANIAEMGSNMIMIMPGTETRGGVRQSSDDMQTLKPADYKSLQEGLAHVSGISPEVSSQGQFINGNNNYPSKVSGVAPDYLDIRKLTVEDGSMFTERDLQSAAKVCIIGKTVADELFPNGKSAHGEQPRADNQICHTYHRFDYDIRFARTAYELGAPCATHCVFPYICLCCRVLYQLFHFHRPTSFQAQLGMGVLCCQYSTHCGIFHYAVPFPRPARAYVVT